MSSTVTLYRQSADKWPGGPMVHVLDKRYGFMLLSPLPCQHVLAAILAETATVERDKLTRIGGDALIRRGYCRHCIGTLA